MRSVAQTTLLLLLLIATVVMSCSRLAPAGFWTSYRPASIVAQDSDQGPWGGHRWIHWLEEEGNSFELPAVVAFATEAGWECGEATQYGAEETATWVRRDDPIFPVLRWRKFPRHLQGQLSVVECETGWIREAPGSGETSPAFGYIVMGNNDRGLAVYHLWGDV